MPTVDMLLGERKLKFSQLINICNNTLVRHDEHNVAGLMAGATENAEHENVAQSKLQ